MGTFSEPELCNFAVIRALAVFAQASDRIIIGIYSRECLLADRAAKYNVGRRKLKADALLRIGHHQADRSLKLRSYSDELKRRTVTMGQVTVLLTSTKISGSYMLSFCRTTLRILDARQVRSEVRDSPSASRI